MNRHQRRRQRAMDRQTSFYSNHIRHLPELPPESLIWQAEIFEAREAYLLCRQRLLGSHPAAGGRCHPFTRGMGRSGYRAHSFVSIGRAFQPATSRLT
jgi:hypothetical protein